MALSRLTPEQMVAAFGDPSEYLGSDGTVSTGWERQIVGYAKLPAPLPLSWLKTVRVSRFKCHRRLIPHFEAALADTFGDPEVWATVNDFGGCYEFRANRRDPKRLSAHAFGAGIDLDVAENPQGREPKVHPRLPGIWERNGFLWGGTFKGKAKDGMHFEFADLGRLSPWLT